MSETSIFFSVLIPVVGALLIGASRKLPNIRETITLITAIFLFLFNAQYLPDILDGERPEFALMTIIPNVELLFSIEPLGLLFALVASSLWIINSIYSIGYMRANKEKNQTRFYVCFAIALSSTMGIAYAGNLITLFLFYEILTLCTYPLVTHHGTHEARHGGRIYLGILMSTSILFLLLAIGWTWLFTGTLEFTPNGIFNHEQLQTSIPLILMALYVFGVGKAAIMPFHRWLPAAMVAPTPVSALLHAVAVVKAGVFSIVKILVYVFGIANLEKISGGSWLMYLAGFTIIAASVVALKSDNLKTRLAYSTISQLSYVILALALFVPIAVMGAALHIVAHAFSKITLFFAAGAIYTASKKTKVSELNGIGKRMPITMIAFTIGALSLIGIPPAIGFLSKWYILSGAFDAQETFVVAVIIISTLLNAAYFLPIIYAAFFRTDDNSKNHGEAPTAIIIAMASTGILSIALFFFSDQIISLGYQIAPAY
tara:strand:+ start:1423 stop:2880 length:1458 start_codon:yes stop_codon:yes gene_type:complete